MQSYGCEIVCALKISEVNEPPKDVDSILVNISSEVSSCSKIGSILGQKLSPG
jgi:hypothetical protein